MATLQRFSARLIATSNVDVSVTGVGVVIDGVAVADLDEVVLNGQLAGAENGLWVAHAGGAWVRHADFDAAEEMLKGTEFYIREGGLDNASSMWTFNTGGAITVGTTAVEFKRETWGRGAALDGTGLTREPTSNAWSLVETGTPTGYFTRVLVDEFGRTQDALESETQTTFIEGLRLVYNSAASITVEAGSAYIPGVGAAVELELDAVLSGLALTANTWGYVYLYETGGVGAIEVSSQGPVSTPYLADARIKGPDGGPDATRRYIGAIRGSASANTMRKFVHALARQTMFYAEAGIAINLGGAATSYAVRDLSAWVPPTNDRAYVDFNTNASSGVDVNLDTANATTQTWQVAKASNASTAWVPLSATQQLMARNTSGSGSSDISVRGYSLAR